MPCFAASCAVVTSPRNASSATRALNSAAYRVRLPGIGSVLFTGRTELIHLSEIPGPAHSLASRYGFAGCDSGQDKCDKVRQPHRTSHRCCDKTGCAALRCDQIATNRRNGPKNATAGARYIREKSATARANVTRGLRQMRRKRLDATKMRQAGHFDLGTLPQRQACQIVGADMNRGGNYWTLFTLSA